MSNVCITKICTNTIARNETSIAHLRQLLLTETDPFSIAGIQNNIDVATAIVQTLRNLSHVIGNPARNKAETYLTNFEKSQLSSANIYRTTLETRIRNLNTWINDNSSNTGAYLSELMSKQTEQYKNHIEIEELYNLGYSRQLEEERIERERLEAIRLEAERIERERLEAIRLEAERIERERLEAERIERERLAYLALLARLAREKANREAAEAQRKSNQCLILTSDNKAIQAQDEETLRERIMEEGTECFILTPEDIEENGTVWEEYDLRGVTPSFIGEDCEAKRAELKEKNIRKEELIRQYKIDMADQLLMDEERGREFVQRAILSAQKVAEDSINQALLQCQTVDDPDVRRLVLQSVAQDAQKLAQDYLDGLFKDRGIYEPVSGVNNYMAGEPTPVISI